MGSRQGMYMGNSPPKGGAVSDTRLDFVSFKFHSLIQVILVKH